LGPKRHLFVLSTHGIYLFGDSSGPGQTGPIIIQGQQALCLEGWFGGEEFTLHVDDDQTSTYTLWKFGKKTDPLIIGGLMTLLHREQAWGQPDRFLNARKDLQAEAMSVAMAAQYRDAQKHYE
jgi:hypothetical protein